MTKATHLMKIKDASWDKHHSVSGLHVFLGAGMKTCSTQGWQQSFSTALLAGSRIL